MRGFVAAGEFVRRPRVDVPAEIVPLLALPARGLVEGGASSEYFVVPTSAYSVVHVDPFFVVTGEDDPVAWADYVFGTRRYGGRVHAVLIDKARRVGVEAILESVYADGGGWDQFARAVREALEIVKSVSEIDHVVISDIFGEHRVARDDAGAWAQ